jgi:LmbE family N-acetylglucosaminyl deacetylase
MAGPLTLLAVHGHPDDETVHVGGTLARYAAEGVRVVCITCTRGELGQIVDSELATPENQQRLGDIRMEEMERALRILGPIEWRWLGYRDSGADPASAAEDPEAFWRQDVDAAAGCIAALIRELRPQVVITHNEHGDDGHPDHIAAARATCIAFERAGDPTAWPDQIASGLEPWEAAKLYEGHAQLGRGSKVRRLVREVGYVRAVPTIARAVVRWRPREERERQVAATRQRPVTTRVDVRPWIEARYRAIREFRTQVAPNDILLALSPDELRRFAPTEDYTLREAHVATHLPERDLFAGLRPTGDPRAVHPERPAVPES